MVNFMIVGAMKAGTTTLTELVRSHPDIEIPPRETQFFARNINWRQNLDQYESFFINRSAKLLGEASTHYTYYPEFRLELWNDIYEYNKRMKFIYIVRHPVDRALSQYMHMYERGYTKLTLEEAFRREPTIINNGRYFSQIKPFIDLFGGDSVLILDFDDLVRNRRDLLLTVSNFLEVDPIPLIQKEPVHENATIGGGKWNHKYDSLKNKLNFFRPYFPTKFRNRIWDIITQRHKLAFKVKPIISPELRRLVLNLSLLDIKALEDFTGKDFSKWLVNEHEA